MYKEIFLVAFVSCVMLSATVESTPIVCDELLRIFDDKSSRRGTLGRIRNAINRACTALDLLRHGINPLDLITNDETKKPRRGKKVTTDATTTSTAAPGTSSAASANDVKTILRDQSSTTAGSTSTSVAVTSSMSPLEVILKNPQVNIILTNHSANDLSGYYTKDSVERAPYNGQLETRVAVDSPRHLLPLDFNPHDLKRPYPAVYEVRTKFSCDKQPHNPGVYADMSLGCKVFHLCASTDPYHNRTSFYCPDSLLFNQEMLRCDYAKNVNCHESYKHFIINESFNKKFDIKYVVLGKVN